MIDLTGKHNPVLLFSAGLDSTLLLSMLIEQGSTFDIVQFGREFWTKEQKQRADDLIRKWDLKVFSYPPAATSFIGQDDEIALVREFALMGTKVLMVSDVIEGDRCIADLDSYRAYAPPSKWDLAITGAKSEDRHPYAFEGQVIPSDRWTVGETEFYAPFYDKSRDWVKAELALRGLPHTEVSDAEDTGNISLCTKCLQGVETFCPKENSIIPPVQWDRSANLAAFRAAYAA